MAKSFLAFFSILSDSSLLKEERQRPDAPPIALPQEDRNLPVLITAAPAGDVAASTGTPTADAKLSGEAETGEAFSALLKDGIHLTLRHIGVLDIKDFSDPTRFKEMFELLELNRALKILLAKVPVVNRTTIESALFITPELTIDTGTLEFVEGYFLLSIVEGTQKKVQGPRGFFIHTHPLLPMKTQRGTRTISLSATLMPSRADANKLTGAIVIGTETSGYFILHYNFQDAQNAEQYELLLNPPVKTDKIIEELLRKGWGRIFNLKLIGEKLLLEPIDYKDFVRLQVSLRENIVDFMAELGYKPKANRTVPALAAEQVKAEFENGPKDKDASSTGLIFYAEREANGHVSVRISRDIYYSLWWEKELRPLEKALEAILNAPQNQKMANWFLAQNRLAKYIDEDALSDFRLAIVHHAYEGGENPQEYMEEYLRIAHAIETNRDIRELFPAREYDLMKTTTSPRFPVPEILKYRKFFAIAVGPLKGWAELPHEILPDKTAKIEDLSPEDIRDPENLVIYEAFRADGRDGAANRIFLRAQWQGWPIILERSSSHDTWRLIELMENVRLVKLLCENAMELHPAVSARLDSLYPLDGEGIHAASIDIDGVKALFKRHALTVGLDDGSMDYRMQANSNFPFDINRYDLGLGIKAFAGNVNLVMDKLRQKLHAHEAAYQPQEPEQAEAMAVGVGLRLSEQAVEPFAIEEIGARKRLIRLIRRRNVSAIQAAGIIRAPLLVEPLIGCLKDGDSVVRQEAAIALGKIGEPAVEPLIGCLKDDIWYVRHQAAIALSNIGDKRAVEPLRERSKTDEEWRVREQAAITLGEIGDEKAIEPLFECLKDEYRDVRREAAIALGNIGDERAVEPLRERSKTDEEWRVREQAAIVLGKIGDLEAVLPLRKHRHYYEAEQVISGFRQANPQYDVGIAPALAQEKESYFSPFRLSGQEARQLLEDIQGNIYRLNSELIPDLVNRIDCVILVPEFLGEGELGFELQLKIGEFLDWLILPIKAFEQYKELAVTLKDRFIMHSRLYSFYLGYDISADKDTRSGMVSDLVIGVSSSPLLARALCWWVIEQESKRRGNYQVRKKALEGIRDLAILTEEDRNRLLQLAIADRSMHVRALAREILYEKTDYIDVYLLRRLYEIETTTRVFLEQESAGLDANSRDTLQRWVSRLERFRKDIASDINFFAEGVLVPFGVKGVFRHRGENLTAAFSEAQRQNNHLAYRTAHTPGLFEPAVDTALRKRLELVNLRWDIEDRRLPLYFERAITRTVNENLATSQENPLLNQYRQKPASQERIQFIKGLSLDDKAHALDFLTYLIVNWEYEEQGLTKEGMFSACNKLVELVNKGKGEDVLFSMFGYVKQSTLSDEITQSIAWDGISDYCVNVLKRQIEDIDKDIEAAERRLKFAPTTETALVKLEEQALARLAPSQPPSVIKQTGQRLREGIRQRFLGESEDFDYLPPQFEISQERVKRQLGLRPSLSKEESLKMLKKARKDFAKRFQETTDSKEREYAIEMLKIISQLLKEERQRLDAPPIALPQEDRNLPVLITAAPAGGVAASTGTPTADAKLSGEAGANAAAENGSAPIFRELPSILLPEIPNTFGDFTKNGENILVPSRPIVLPPASNGNQTMVSAILDIDKAMQALSSMKNTADTRAMENTGELSRHLGALNIIELKYQNPQEAAQQLSLLLPQLFVILQYCQTDASRQSVYNIFAKLQLSGYFKPNEDQRHMLLESLAAHIDKNELLSRKFIEQYILNLASLTEEEYSLCRKIIKGWQRLYYFGGLPSIPSHMTFGIELEFCILDSAEGIDESATRRLFNELSDYVKNEGLGGRWKIKIDGQMVEITTGEGGLANTKEGFTELRAGLEKILLFTQDYAGERKYSQGMHIHVGDSSRRDLSAVMPAVAWIGKSMEFFWRGLSGRNNILTFRDRFSNGALEDDKNMTPFYYDKDTDTIAFNVFAPVRLGLLQERNYFLRLQQTIAIALAVVHNASLRPFDFNIMRTGLPALQHSLYTRRTSYLLRRHLTHLFGNNPEMIVNMLQLLMDHNAIPVMPLEGQEETEFAAELYKSAGLAELYDSHVNTDGWNEQSLAYWQGLSTEAWSANPIETIIIAAWAGVESASIALTELTPYLKEIVLTSQDNESKTMALKGLSNAARARVESASIVLTELNLETVGGGSGHSAALAAGATGAKMNGEAGAERNAAAVDISDEAQAAKFAKALATGA